MSIDVLDVPVILLAGGLGTRISEESTLKPKPMIEIGDLPVLLHVMRRYYAFGFRDFVICAGYKSWEIKKYFLTYEYRCNDLEIDHREAPNTPAKPFGENTTQEKWRVRILDTGAQNLTGSRVAQALDLLEQSGQKFNHFALTYGDGLCDVNLKEEFNFHQSHQKIGTVLAVKPVARFGELDIDSKGAVEGFLEKPEFRQSLINGGFFFLKKEFRKYLSTDESCVLERTPLEKLANDKELMSYPHKGFWYPMDTLRDKIYLQSLWDQNKAPWVKY